MASSSDCTIKSSLKDASDTGQSSLTSQLNTAIDNSLLVRDDGKLNYECTLEELEEANDNSDHDPDFVEGSEESYSGENSSLLDRPSTSNCTKSFKYVPPKKQPQSVIQNTKPVNLEDTLNVEDIIMDTEQLRETLNKNDKDRNIPNENVANVQSKTIKRTRKRRKDIENWADNKRKKTRNCGLEYTNRQGKIVEKRELKKPCNLRTCAYNCKNFTEEDRREIFSKFWEIGDLRLQREFVIRSVSVNDVVRSRKENSKRKCTNVYTLKKGDTELQVCKIFFLSTLNVSEKMVRTSLSMYNNSMSGIIKDDQRGKASPPSKYSDDTMNLVLQHINSFPRVPPHWCRKDTKKEYLESILNRERMYALYLQFCKEKSVKPVCKTTYKETLTKLNIGFHVPKKDQCWCYEFELLPSAEKEPKQEEYEIHLKRKKAAKEEKEIDAKKSASDATYMSANFDLEAVLYCPLKFAKPVFYKRKLACYNFTVYVVGEKEGHCYFWDETTGNRGAIEVASCLFKFIAGIAAPVTHLSFFSDCCPGQNRNSIVVSMLQFALSTHQSLKCIDLKFLEPGHTHMECDSMHATIEAASQVATIYCPRDWLNVIKLSKKNSKPYEVKVMRLEDMLDFKAWTKHVFVNKKEANDSTKLNWGSVKWFRLVKDNPNMLYFKNEFWDAEFKELNMKKRPNNEHKPKRISKSCSFVDEVQPASLIIPAYKKNLPLSEAKLNDLKELCRTGVIPKDYHPFYEKLKEIDNGQKKKMPSNQTDDEDELSLAEMKRKFLKKRKPRK